MLLVDNYLTLDTVGLHYLSRLSIKTDKYVSKLITNEHVIVVGIGGGVAKTVELYIIHLSIVLGFQ